MILHHYPFSPYSQKIRSMLGYTGLSWQSALTREMPPRPILDALVGGYRRIPVAQLGADLFCDSRVIAAEIARMSGRPELDPVNTPPALKDWLDAVEGEVFFACVLAGGSKRLNRKVRASMSWLDIARFLIDRINLGRKAAVPLTRPKDARPRVLRHLGEVEKRLDSPFLNGALPGHADFAVYHGLWFIRDLGERRFIDDFPRTVAWMDRIRAFGDGFPEELQAVETLAIARLGTPRPIPHAQHRDPLIGKRVRIAPDDYGQTPTRGVLVGADETRLILARELPGGGLVHVHFPRRGYLLTPEN